MSSKKKWKIMEEAFEFSSSNKSLSATKNMKKKKPKTGKKASATNVQTTHITQTTRATTIGDDKTVIARDTVLLNQIKLVESIPSNLVMIFGPEAMIGSYWPINKQEIIIGRNWRSDICIRDLSISKEHLAIYSDTGDKISIKDLNSTNGTYVNEHSIQPQTSLSLNDNDIIKLGNVGFKFLNKGNHELSSIIKNYQKSFYDMLTEVGNRSMLEVKSPEFFHISKRAKSTLSLILLDIDFFKKINDTYGHQAGDFILKQIGQILRSNFRSDDLLTRCGGEEFCILLHSQITHAQKAIEKMRKTLENQTFNYNGKNLKITISAGITERIKTDTSWKNMYERADRALYESKNTGRNKVSMSV